MNNTTTVTDDILLQYDSILASRSYAKIWSELPKKEKEILYAVAKTKKGENSEVISQGIKQNELSVYRYRLLKRGIIKVPERGLISFVLPRFKEFIINYYDFYNI